MGRPRRYHTPVENDSNWKDGPIAASFPFWGRTPAPKTAWDWAFVSCPSSMRSTVRSWEKHFFVVPSGQAYPWSARGDLELGSACSQVLEEEKRFAMAVAVGLDRALPLQIRPLASSPSIPTRPESPEAHCGWVALLAWQGAPEYRVACWSWPPASLFDRDRHFGFSIAYRSLSVAAHPLNCWRND